MADGTRNDAELVSQLCRGVSCRPTIHSGVDSHGLLLGSQLCGGIGRDERVLLGRQAAVDRERRVYSGLRYGTLARVHAYFFGRLGRLERVLGRV